MRQFMAGAESRTFPPLARFFVIDDDRGHEDDIISCCLRLHTKEQRRRPKSEIKARGDPIRVPYEEFIWSIEGGSASWLLD